MHTVPNPGLAQLTVRPNCTDLNLDLDGSSAKVE